MQEQQQPKIADEMGKMPYEPLLPIEKKLISWSLGLGIVLWWCSGPSAACSSTPDRLPCGEAANACRCDRYETRA